MDATGEERQDRGALAPTPAPKGRGEIARPHVTYEGRAIVTPEGLGTSVETTRWRDVAPVADDPAQEAMILDHAARRAALRYGARVKDMSLGLLGPVERDGGGTSLYVRPLGLKLLEVMAFGPLERADSGEYFHAVEEGLLATPHAPLKRRGRLYFRWFRDGRDEVFQTEVRDFIPRIAGKRRTWLGLKLYEYTQMLLHRWVMWRYHVWVQGARDALLAEAAHLLPDAAGGSSNP